MTQAVTVFRWDDPGAPQIVDGRASEYLNVLKKCLVDGYGTKAPLGWILSVDEHLSQAPYMVLKNDTTKGASGGAVVFSATDNTPGGHTKVQCCQSYIDKENLFNAGSSFVFHRSGTGYNLLKNWMVIGTETAFYIFSTSDARLNYNYFGTYQTILYFVGDFHSNYSNDIARFITIAGQSTDVTSHSWNNMLNGKFGYSSSNNITNIFPLDGSQTRVKHSISNLFGTTSSVSQTSISNEIEEVFSLAECYLFAGINVSISNNSQYLNNPVSPWFRGKVPGLVISVEAGFLNATMPHIKTINGMTHFQIPSANSDVSCAWINMEQW